MAETIFLVRHGESASNAEKYFAGWLDSPLTALGRKQAHLLRKRLAREGIGRVFCSDLSRARETAELLSLRCPVVYSRALREKNYGKLEGVNWGEDGPKYARYHSDAYARPPGGENCVDVQKRVVSYFNSSLLCAREEKVLVVSHHGPIVLLACHLLGMPVKNWRKLRLGNCGLCILTVEDGVWRLKLWNSLSHYGLLTFRPLLSREAKVRH